MLFWIRVGSYLIAFVFGCAFVGALWRADVKDMELSYQKDFNKAVEASNKRSEALENKIGTNDAKYTKELKDKNNEIDSLRADVAAGRKRLRINATCVPSSQTSATSASLGNASSPELGREAEQDYFSLREDLTLMQKQLEEAQSILRAEREQHDSND